MAPKTKTPQLSKREIQHLRALGHHLSVIGMVGKEGITETLVKSIMANLTAHELIKIRIQDTCSLERQVAVADLAAAAGAAVVQIIGKTAILYRPNPELPSDKRVQRSPASKA